jgi:hypothetical protein
VLDPGYESWLHAKEPIRHPERIGRDGRGDGPVAPALGQKPTDLTHDLLGDAPDHEMR